MSEFNDIWYKSADGLTLYARDYPCVRDSEHMGNSETPTILCIPGLTRNSADFHELSLHLRKRYRVIAVDLRGRGRSAYDTVPANYMPLTYVADVNALVQTLELSRVVLLGTSLGGLVSMLIAASRPAFLCGLIINDVAPQIETAGLERIRSYVGKTGDVDNWQEAVAQTKLLNGKELPDLSDEAWLEFSKKIFKEDESGKPVLAYDPAIAVPFSSIDATPQTDIMWTVFSAVPHVPLLLIRGESSDIVSTDSVARMQKCRPDMIFVEIPQRGHAPLLNENEAVAAIDSLIRAIDMAE